MTLLIWCLNWPLRLLRQETSPYGITTISVIFQQERPMQLIPAYVVGSLKCYLSYTRATHGNQLPPSWINIEMPLPHTLASFSYKVISLKIVTEITTGYCCVFTKLLMFLHLIFLTILFFKLFLLGVCIFSKCPKALYVKGIPQIYRLIDWPFCRSWC